MPIYEYRCNKCKHLVTVLVRDISQPPQGKCSTCGSEQLTRVFSRFAIGKTYQDFYDDILTDHDLEAGMMANDPRALAKWSRKMDAAAGGEMGPEHEEFMRRLESGEDWQKLVTEAQQKELGAEEPAEGPGQSAETSAEGA